MSDNGECFTYIWKIKNFNFCNSQINSPVCFAHVLDGTKWLLSLIPGGKKGSDYVTCYIRRENDDSDTQLIQIDYELSLLSANGSVLYSDMFLKKLYRTFNTDWKSALKVDKDEVFLHKKDLFMPNDTLTVRCRMWKCENPISQSESCFVETSIKTKRETFVGTIKKLRNLDPWETYPICIVSSKVNFLYSMSLQVVDDKLEIKIFVSQKFFRPYRYKIFIRDVYGNKVKFGQGECHDSKLRCFPLILSKKHLMENKKLYYPKNLLTLECEVIFSRGKATEKNVELEYVFDFQDANECKSNAMEANLSSKECHSESFATSVDDFSFLLEDDSLCDMEFKTATENFPAHKVVLSARSPVFKSMFTTDIKRKTNKYVVIDDLDADTVRQMRFYMYSGKLDDLEYESAKNLHFAAHKFNIVSLKEICSNFLKRYILLNNCCDLLLMADKQEDTNLKSAIQDYIAKNDKVIFSNEWKNLEKTHPQLTIEVLRAVYIKKSEVGE